MNKCERKGGSGGMGPAGLEKERKADFRTGWKREQSIGEKHRGSRDPHPADSYNFNYQLATPPACSANSRGWEFICEKLVDLREQEGQVHPFIRSFLCFE